MSDFDNWFEEERKRRQSKDLSSERGLQGEQALHNGPVISPQELRDMVQEQSSIPPAPQLPPGFESRWNPGLHKWEYRKIPQQNNVVMDGSGQSAQIPPRPVQGHPIFPQEMPVLKGKQEKVKRGKLFWALVVSSFITGLLFIAIAIYYYFRFGLKF
jgi:hypothetical protein